MESGPLQRQMSKLLPLKDPSVGIAERLLLLTLAVREPIKRGVINEVPALMKERQAMLDMLGRVPISAEAKVILDEIVEAELSLHQEFEQYRLTLVSSLSQIQVERRAARSYQAAEAEAIGQAA